MNPTPTGPPESESHLSAEDLAVMAEGRSRSQVATGAVEHLARCRSCMSAYADAVRYRAAWLERPGAFDRGAEAALLALRSGGWARSVSRSTWMAAAAGVLVAIGVLVARDPPVRRLPEPIAAMLEDASAEGLVLPGGEAGAAGATSPYRSGPVSLEGERSLERLRVEHERDPRSGRDLYPLAAGLVASAKLDLASDYISEGRRRAPRDHRLIALAGVVAHRGGDLPAAERLLREALQAAPLDPTVMLDLGLVVAEARGGAAAATDLENVIRRAPRSPLAERARRTLSGDQSPRVRSPVPSRAAPASRP